MTDDLAIMSAMNPAKTMTASERDTELDKMATTAATAFYDKYASSVDVHIKANPELYLQHTIPYLTVRTLQRQEKVLGRQEKALESLEKDSRWIKWSAIITLCLTVVLAFLTAVLAFLAWHDYIMWHDYIIRTSPP
jgi:hypothetical protein